MTLELWPCLSGGDWGTSQAIWFLLPGRGAPTGPAGLKPLTRQGVPVPSGTLRGGGGGGVQVAGPDRDHFPGNRAPRVWLSDSLLLRGSPCSQMVPGS